jgi:hypothetical protein
MPSQANTFSTIKFFTLFQAALKKINKAPLDTASLSIQQDVYARLAHLEESDAYLEAPDVFATIENGRKEKDTDLRFSVQFASGCLILEIEGLLSAVYDLRDAAIFNNEADAVEQLIHTLKMLLNGQIAVGLTLYEGEVCASEMIVSDRLTKKHIVMATLPAFKRASKRATQDELEHLVLKNHYTFDSVSTTKASLLYEPFTEETLTAYGRLGEEALSRPLTYKEFKDRIEDEVKVKIGQKPGQSDMAYLFTSWEFWVIGLILGVIPIGLRLTHYLPSIFVNNPSLASIPLTIVAAILTPYVKEKRLARKK